jgi:CrcB-like protein, Camphor Resistance (CrcB)
MSFSTCLLIAVGGALGTLARYLISVAAVPFSHTLPWGTILINVSGSFVIGLFGTLTLSQGRYPLPEAAPSSPGKPTRFRGRQKNLDAPAPEARWCVCPNLHHQPRAMSGTDFVRDHFALKAPWVGHRYS